MTQYLKPFEPVAHGGFYVANATSASTLADLPESADVVALYNTSDTAIVFWHCHPYSADNTTQATVPTTSPVGDMPIPPGMLVRLSVPKGRKQFSVISSAADGNLYIMPGVGN